MRVDLPRGQWADFRDLADLKGGDAKAIRRATKFKVHNGALAEISMGVDDEQTDALLTRIITSWEVRAADGTSLGMPQFDKTSLDEVPLDVYNALVEAAQPYKDAIDKAGKATTGSETESAPTSSPAILQGSAISQPTPSTSSSSSDGSPNDGTGPPPSPLSNPSSF